MSEQKDTQAAPQPAPESVTLPKAELDALRARVDEYLRMAQRVQADFSNYQKRVARDREQESRWLVEKLLLGLLPALDTFELALKQAPKGAEAFVKGMELAQREIFRNLEMHGLKRIAAAGTFSPAVHEAIMQVEEAGKEAGEIVAELRPGYTLYEKVLRPSQVSVAAARPADGKT
ncbi:MAG: nucleotide exchange factor GrpE [Planctomycetia bacterium]|nr:nucleotide exchange factor GrpE [Planctomycetia bacterium]